MRLIPVSLIQPEHEPLVRLLDSLCPLVASQYIFPSVKNIWSMAAWNMNVLMTYEMQDV